MEDESKFEKLSKVSIKSLLNENFFQDISIIKNGSRNATLIIIKDGQNISLAVSKKTVQKIDNINNYEEIAQKGHIVLINNLLSIHSLRFYMNEYLNLDDYFEIVNDDKKIKNDRELIKQIILQQL
ncbi:hypothetical protein SOM12_11340 [Flavobacterium sp. CFBP9031]|uniref:hypothetical protein n=1 Tax=Flavobacterium sp. CFBP9031 TaxID=3096538 RepID=UPI002A6B4B4F|nr:hypothetical protein [Flavobacterium sp. CFBP9031]MDY0988007.1 hypothetical protein [Flavobacterium sp. CFBP9031]